MMMMLMMLMMIMMMMMITAVGQFSSKVDSQWIPDHLIRSSRNEARVT